MHIPNNGTQIPCQEVMECIMAMQAHPTRREAHPNPDAYWPTPYRHCNMTARGANILDYYGAHQGKCNMCVATCVPRRIGNAMTPVGMQCVRSATCVLNADKYPVEDQYCQHRDSIRHEVNTAVVDQG